MIIRALRLFLYIGGPVCGCPCTRPCYLVSGTDHSAVGPNYCCQNALGTLIKKPVHCNLNHNTRIRVTAN